MNNVRILTTPTVLPADNPNMTKPHMIFWDNFNSKISAWNYQAPADLRETPDTRCATPGVGMSGQALEFCSNFQKTGYGTRHLMFGDWNKYRPDPWPLRSAEKFDDVYVRMYVKHHPDFKVGSPTKIFRINAIAAVPGVGHLQVATCRIHSAEDGWSIDPATGVDVDKLVVESYNDFKNLRRVPASHQGDATTIPISAARLNDVEKLRWICLEARMKLNTPGQSDGRCDLWVDGLHQVALKDLNLRGSYTKHTINCVYIEQDKGAERTQIKYIDDFVVSTKPIGPIWAYNKPKLLRTRPMKVKGKKRSKPGKKTWHAQVGHLNVNADFWKPRQAMGQGIEEVWESAELPAHELEVEVDKELLGGMYYCRVAEGDGNWGQWHQPFLVKGTPVEDLRAPE
jgi:hypothetical protein